jgi:Ni/Co efflux regulator RcnB
MEQMMKGLVCAAFTALVASTSVASPLEQLRELGQLRDELRRDRQADRDPSSYERRDEPRDYERRGPREYDRRSDPRGYDDGGPRDYDRRSRSREYDGRDFRDYDRRRGEAPQRE